MVMLTHARGFKEKCWSKKGVFEPKRVQEYRNLWEKEHRRIYLSDEIFDTWQDMNMQVLDMNIQMTLTLLHICCHWNFAAGRFTI